jgi:protein-S-isoprenylcysteine O-methyltransferase Ste14
MTGRGSGWVVAQFALMAAIVASGVLPPGWPESAGRARVALGILLIAAGTGFAYAAGRKLGRSLTPFPRPNDAGLVTDGPFAVVRHPIYLGGLGVFFGYALLTGATALALTLVLLGLWAGKVKVEESLLEQAYDDYGAYRQRVRRRLLPFVY